MKTIEVPRGVKIACGKESAGGEICGDSYICHNCKKWNDDNCTKQESEGCGEYFQYGAGEFICGGALHVDGKKKLCGKCVKSEVEVKDE